jgi:hypothetical protein
MLLTLRVRSVVTSAFCVLDQYASESFGRLRSTRGEGACGVSPTHISQVMQKDDMMTLCTCKVNDNLLSILMHQTIATPRDLGLSHP